MQNKFSLYSICRSRRITSYGKGDDTELTPGCVTRCWGRCWRLCPWRSPAPRRRSSWAPCPDSRATPPPSPCDGPSGTWKNLKFYVGEKYIKRIVIIREERSDETEISSVAELFCGQIMFFVDFMQTGDLCTCVLTFYSNIQIDNR